MKTKTKKLAIVASTGWMLLISSPTANAQNVSIAATPTPPDQSAGLDVNFTDRGLLVPRVALTSSTDATTIQSPAHSLLVYNTGAGGLTPAGYYYNAGTTTAPQWVRLLITGNTPSDAWLTLGNAGTTPGTHFIGTTDNVDLVFKTNNTERMRILSNGRVGIGTMTPVEKLDIVGNARLQSFDAVYKSLNNFGRNFHLIGTYSGWDTAAIYIAGYNYYNPAAGGPTNSYAKRVHIGRPERMTIDLNTGNVGIGTTAPAGKFHVNNDIVGSDSSFVILNNGNVGIGTTAPQSKLEVVASEKHIRIQDAENTPCCGLWTIGTWSALDNNSLVIADDAINPRVTIMETGNVGIGTTAPAGKFHVNNDIVGSDSSFVILNNGNVGIGTSAPSDKLQVNGDIRIGLVQSNPADAGVAGYGNRLYFSGGPSTGFPTKDSDNSDPLWIARYNLSDDDTELRINIGDNGAGGDLDALVVGLTPPNSSSWVPRFYVRSDGNVGIGTMTPGRKLELLSDVSGLSFEAGTGSPNSGVIRFGDNTGWKLHFGRSRESAGGPLNSGTAGVLMTIQDNGNVGIGTTVPGNILTVVQNSTTDPIADAWTVYSTPNSKIVLGTADDEVMNYLEIFKKLPVYKWKRTENEQIRLSAIATESAPKEILAYDADGNIQGIDLQGYIGFLHEVMKAQNKETEALKEETEALKETLKAQQKKIEELIKEIEELKNKH